MDILQSLETFSSSIWLSSSIFPSTMSSLLLFSISLSIAVSSYCSIASLLRQLQIYLLFYCLDLEKVNSCILVCYHDYSVKIMSKIAFFVDFFSIFIYTIPPFNFFFFQKIKVSLKYDRSGKFQVVYIISYFTIVFRDYPG